MCSSRKYPYLAHGRDFFQDPPPLWKFQLNLIHFFKVFGLREPPTPQEIPIPSVGGSMDIFWYCTIALKSKFLQLLLSNSETDKEISKPHAENKPKYVSIRNNL